MDQWWPWIAFNIFVMLMLALDLGVFHRRSHAVGMREAAAWSAMWVSLAMAFACGIYLFRGQEDALVFISGYLIEQALSVDNIFVFLLIFTYFKVPPAYQHRILFFGILGVLVMRGAMIAAGVYLISHFHWIIFVFGAFLIFTGIRMAFQDREDIELQANPLVRLLNKLIPVTHEFHGDQFVVRTTKPGSDKPQLVATPMLLVLVVVEFTDLIFAIDSIPAIFAITFDPFLVYTSNVFAVLGLRSLYFLLCGVMDRFHYLKIGLSFVLSFVGVKMLIKDIYEIPVAVSLLVIAGILFTAVVASMLFPKSEAECPSKGDRAIG